VELPGKVALVTGAGSGLGRAIAHRFGSEGTAVVVVDIDGSAADETVEQMSGTATAVTADVADAAHSEAMVRQAEVVFGGLDVLVNNAGGYETPVFPEAPLEHWKRTVDVNLLAVMLGIQFALPALERRGGGAIVNVASSAGLGFGPYEGAPEYAAAKAGVMRLTACLASLAERAIRVNCVCPHTVATEGVLDAIAELTADGSELPPALQDTPLTVDEVVEAVVWLATEDELAGRVAALRGGRPARLLAAEEGS
jgi:NAD(P)-dependent dehydrogenase (short-subunit alcohol dehydrogenase family)